MALTSPYACLLLLAALLAVCIRPTPARSDTAVAPARTVEGIATTPSGKPLPHATLYLFGLPPGQTDMIELGDQSTVVTDDKGRFVWAVPAALPPLSHYIENGGMRCYALAADRSAEQFRAAVRPGWHGTDAEGAARDLLTQATRPCETKWLLGGATPVFSVVVPDTTNVTLTVRGPDGQPLRAHEVQVVPTGLAMDYKGSVVYTARTDAEGRLRLRCFPGSLRFQIFAAGVGFGSTGTFDVGPGQSVAPALPPLAPFAQISGTVDPSLVGPNAVLHLDYFNTDGPVWYDPRAVINAQGGFRLMGMLPGPHRLVLAGGLGESEPLTVTVQPGEQADGIVIGPKKAVPDAFLPGGFGKTGSSLPANKPSVRGRVTDTEGRPVAGADVYAVCSYFGGIRGYQEVLTAKTDVSGDYVISNIPGGVQAFGTSIHLVAHQPGFPLAFGDAESEKGSISGQWKDMQVNLVIPALHSSLTVRVLRDGKPLPDVPVKLESDRTNWVTPALYHGSDRGEAAQALRNLLGPSAQTGLDGTARFTNLTAGVWDVTANRAPYFNFLDKTLVPPFNVSLGVAVQAGKDQSYTLSLLPPPPEAAFHFASPNGLPLKAVPTSMSVTTPRYPNYGNISLVPDGMGNGRAAFGEPGLFQITAQVGDRLLNINALVGPYFEGTALVAVSAATAPSQSIAVAIHRVGPASIRVRLVDAQGKPLRGTVTIGNGSASALYAASVDAGGTVVFPNIPLNFFPYTVTAHIAGRPERLVPSRQNGPLPSDAALIAGTGQPLPQSLRVRGGEENLVTFGSVSPGYVRLRLTGPFASATGYYIEGRQSNDEAFVETHFDPTSGEYLIGPLPAGRRTLHLFRYVPAPVATNLEAGAVTVTVKAGQVVPATLSAQSTAAQELLYSLPLSGTALMPDGKTPAWGARVALFLPDRLQ
ncbi:MAG: carboxypeptidase-like regulatory domain-containing protein, partial [Armatimonadota bacterium]|nr:carboxypeptidase-like regulatory domain-containing protein [Armatimonadota bacterium]